MRNLFNRGKFSRSLISVGLGLILGTGLLSSFAVFSGSAGTGQSVAYAATSAPASTSSASPTTVTQTQVRTVTQTTSSANAINGPANNAFQGILPSAQQLGLNSPTIAPLWQAYPSGSYTLDIAAYKRFLLVLPLGQMVGGIADMLWGLGMVIAKATILLLIWSFKVNFLNSSIGTIVSYSQSAINALLGGSTLVILTLLIGGYAVYRGIIQYQVSRMLRSILASVIVLAVAFGYVGHLQQYIIGGSNLANALSGVVMSSIDAPLLANQGSAGSILTCQTGTGGPHACGYTQVQIPNTISNALVAGGNQLWKTEVQDPWTALEFGSVASVGPRSSIKFTQAEASAVNSWESSQSAPNSYGAAVLLTQSTGVPVGSSIYFGLKWALGSSDPLTQSAGYPTITAGESIPQTLLTYAPLSKFREEVVHVLANPNISHAGHPDVQPILSGQSVWSTLGATIMSVILDVVVLLAIGSLAIEMTIAQVIVIVALLVAPLVMFIGTFPEIGFNIFLRWLKLLLGALFVRVLLSGFIGVMFFGLDALIGGMSYGNYFQPYLIGILVVGATWYMRRMIKKRGFGQMPQMSSAWAGAGAGALTHHGQQPNQGSPDAPAMNQAGRTIPLVGRSGMQARADSASSAPPQESRFTKMSSGLRDRAKKMGFDLGFGPHGDTGPIHQSAGAKIAGAMGAMGRGMGSAAKATKSGARHLAGRGTANNPMGQSIHRSLAQRMAGQMTSARQAKHNAAVARQRAKGLTPFSAQTPLKTAHQHLGKMSLWGMDRTSSALNKARDAKGAKKVGWGALAVGSGVFSAGAMGLGMAASGLNVAHSGLRRMDEAILAPVASHVFGVDLKPQTGHGNPSIHTATDAMATSGAPVAEEEALVPFPEIFKPAPEMEGVSAKEQAKREKAWDPKARPDIPDAPEPPDMTERAREATANRQRMARERMAQSAPPPVPEQEAHPMPPSSVRQPLRMDAPARDTVVNQPVSPSPAPEPQVSQPVPPVEIPQTPTPGPQMEAPRQPVPKPQTQAPVQPAPAPRVPDAVRPTAVAEPPRPTVVPRTVKPPTTPPDVSPVITKPVPPSDPDTLFRGKKLPKRNSK